MILPSLPNSPLRVALTTVPEEVDWTTIQDHFPERPLDQLSPQRRLEHAAVSSGLAQLGIDQVLHNASGKPICQTNSISISHALDHAGQVWAAVAAAPFGQQIGIDIERPRPQLVRVAPRIFSPAEQTLIADHEAWQSVVWNIKEAGWKAFGPNLDYRTEIETIAVPDVSRLATGATASVRIRALTHRFYVAQLPQGLSIAVGPLPQD